MSKWEARRVRKMKTLRRRAESQARIQELFVHARDKGVKVIADTRPVTLSLERLQAERIADKHFTVYRRPAGDVGLREGDST
jgi:predicted peroxiredoxin